MPLSLPRSRRPRFLKPRNWLPTPPGADLPPPSLLLTVCVNASAVSVLSGEFPSGSPLLQRVL